MRHVGEHHKGWKWAATHSRQKWTLTDADILDAMKKWGNGNMTYVLRNILSPGRPHLKTSHILSRLKRMERAGKVKRVPSCYQVQICWAVAHT